MKRLLRFMMACILAAGGGCQSVDEMTARTSEQAQAILGAEGHAYDIDIDTLAVMIDQAAGEMHWGVARITNEITALNAAAWTAGDEPVDIRAQQTGVTGVDVQVKVGLFGNTQAEQAFYDALAAAIAQHRDQSATR